MLILKNQGLIDIWYALIPNILYIHTLKYFHYWLLMYSIDTNKFNY